MERGDRDWDWGIGRDSRRSGMGFSELSGCVGMATVGYGYSGSGAY